MRNKIAGHIGGVAANHWQNTLDEKSITVVGLATDIELAIFADDRHAVVARLSRQRALWLSEELQRRATFDPKPADEQD